MVKNIVLSICVSLCIMAPLSAQTKPSRLGQIKAIACRVTTKATPTIAATLISIPILWFAQNYLSFTYTVDLKTSKSEWVKKTKES